MSIPGFDAAQARYDSMLPPEPEIFRCSESQESNEDCDLDHECQPEEWDGPDYEEPPDFDERRYERDSYDYFD